MLAPASEHAGATRAARNRAKSIYLQCAPFWSNKVPTRAPGPTRRGGAVLQANCDNEGVAYEKTHSADRSLCVQLCSAVQRRSAWKAPSPQTSEALPRTRAPYTAVR